QRLQLELVAGIEAAGLNRAFLAQEPVGADDAGMVGAGKRPVDDQEMVADIVEAVRVAALLPAGGIGPRAKLVVKDPEADGLRRRHLFGRARQAGFEAADAAQRLSAAHGGN